MKSAIVFQNQPAVEITDERNKIILSPDRGARLLRWERDGGEVIMWPADANWSKLNKVRGGNPILFPFLARTFLDGRLGFWNDAGTERLMPQHGFGRDMKYVALDEKTENALRMRLADTAESRAMYPFSFQFDVVIALLPGDRLEFRFEMTNTGKASLPWYAGHHFYFAVPHLERADWTLDLPCAEWGRQRSDGSIAREKAATPLLSLDDPLIIDRFQIAPTADKITLRNSKSGRQMVIDLAPEEGTVPWYAVTTWTEFPESDFYCVEPWLGLPNAIHHGQGLRHLASGQTETAVCVLDASKW